MSRKHPIIAVTGSSGAGTSNARWAFERIFRVEGIKPALIEGDCFHRYNREEMNRLVGEAERHNRRLTHFGPEGNHFDKLEMLFKEYADRGTGQKRYYIHNAGEASLHGYSPGELTPWEPLEDDTDLLFYEGLHGGIVTDTINVARHVDLLIGVAPIINLEWIQKIHRDKAIRGYSSEDAIDMILSRMHDYVQYITPQFSRTDINFQRVATIDTANPFDNDLIPTDAESFSIIHVRNRDKIPVDFHHLLDALAGSLAFTSAPDTIVVSADKKVFAMQLILAPVIRELVKCKSG